MSTVDTVLKDKSLEDLKDTPTERVIKKPTLTQVKVEKALKYLKFQNGSQGNTTGNEEFLGKGDGQICSLVDITKDQLKQVRKGLDKKIAELTSSEVVEPVEEPEE